MPAAGPSLSQDFATPAFHYRSLPQPLLRDSTKLPPANSIPAGEAGRVIHDTFFLSGGAPAGRGPAAEPPARSLASPQKLAGKGLGKQLPNPAAASLVPGSQADVVQLGAPTLRSWGPGDRACCRSRPRSQQHGDVPRCPVPLQREPPQLQSTTGPGTAPCGHGGEAGRRRPRAPGGAELMEQLLAGRCHPRSASGYPSRAEVTA